ncbi:MAG: metallophosphoesterase [Ferruginibacter sp.]
MLNRRIFLLNSLLAGAGLLFSSFKKWAWENFNSLPFRILLGRATTKSITIRILPKADIRLFISYEAGKTNTSIKTSPVEALKNNPVDIVLDNLSPGQEYFYQVFYQVDPGADFTASPACRFRTGRAKKEPFVFTVTADSHLGTLKHCDPALYQLTLDNAAANKPDLHFSLGDDFRASRVNEPDYEKIEQLYLNQLDHLGSFCHSTPFYFILGNHELEAKAFDDGTENCLAAWSARARKKFIPNPLPNDFYSGNTTQAVTEKGRQNYYAFEWGDVLFVAMDVFWYSNISAADEEMREQNKQANEGLSREEKQQLREERQKAKEEGRQNKNPGDKQKHKDQWNFTIGEAQYQWLAQTLEKSRTRYKFVMGHHVLGSCRGGVEWAGTFEWGGKNRREIDEFTGNRPGWKAPIHQLFVKNNVTAFIQGHDHLFVRQDLDGISYITCPMSGDPGYNTYNSDHYLSGDKLSNTGHLKFTVNSDDVTLEYIKAVLPKDEAIQGVNGHIAYAWSFANRTRTDKS